MAKLVLWIDTAPDGAVSARLQPTRVRTDGAGGQWTWRRRDGRVALSHPLIGELTASASSSGRRQRLSPARLAAAVSDAPASRIAVAGAPEALRRLAAADHTAEMTFTGHTVTVFAGPAHPQDCALTSAAPSPGGWRIRTMEPPAAAAAAAALCDAPHDLDPAVFDVAEMAEADSDDGRLWPGQRHATAALQATSRGAVLVGGTGSGKTVVTLTALASAAGRIPRWRGLVLCPPGLRDQWAAAARQWLPGAQVLTVDGSGGQRAYDADRTQPGPLLVLASTGALPQLAETLSWRRWHDLVVDEAAWLGNPASQRSRAAARLRGRADRAAVLTATPPRGQVAPLLAWARPGEPTDEASPAVLRPTADGTGAPPPSHLDRVALSASHLAELDSRCAAELSAAASAVERKTALDRVRRRLLSPDLHVDGALEATKRRWVADAAAAAVGDGAAVVVAVDDAASAAQLVGELADAGVTAASSHAGVDAPDLTVFQRGEVDVALVGAAGQQGFDLQRAVVLLHADVPATPAVTRQRHGRVVRPGGPPGVRRLLAPVVDGWVEPALADLTLGSPAASTVDAVARAVAYRLSEADIPSG